MFDHKHTSGTTCPNFTNFLLVLPVGVPQSIYGGIATLYVLPVLWMMLCCPLVGPVAQSILVGCILKTTHSGPTLDCGGEYDVYTYPVVYLIKLMHIDYALTLAFRLSYLHIL